MKILHTADWHIGKRLHKHYLYQDFDYFIDWLCQLISQREIEVVLISGDIFDFANPSAEARKQYYNALVRLYNLGCILIITGGNHDSPTMLNAPKELLKSLNVHVTAAFPDNLKDLLIPLYQNGKIKKVVAAVPYLRDSNLYTASQGTSYEEKIETMREGITNIYQEVADLAAEIYPGIPCIAMGHLFAAGVTTSESERDIQIGNAAMFNAFHFGDYFSYIALGHIHKPQQVHAHIPTYYSGSPLALSFSEREDQKRVLLLDTAISWEPESIDVPSIRSLLRIQGNQSEIEEKLSVLHNNTELDCLVEVCLEENQYSTEKILYFQEFIQNFEKEGFIIIKDSIQFKTTPDSLIEVFSSRKSMENLSPKEVFTSLIDQEEMDKELKNRVIASFHEILESLES